MPENGYAWWYVDGVNPETGQGISIIAFIGSVFSPWYKWSGRRKPENHVCINVATYGPGGRFTMTDRGQSALIQQEHLFQVGPSSLSWDPDTGALTIDIDEISSLPLVSRVRGRVVVRTTAVTDVEMPLTQAGTHVWRPFAPNAHIEVDLERSGWQWQGHGYFDANFGTRALEQDFGYWTWGRFPTSRGTRCFYDLVDRAGRSSAYDIEFSNDGQARSRSSSPPLQRFARSGWQVYRHVRCDAQAQPKQLRSFLDAPFYSRASVETKIDGETSAGVFEALDLKRFANPVILAMLAVRVPRRARWSFK